VVLFAEVEAVRLGGADPALMYFARNYHRLAA